jgi:hypothetical protein
LATFTYVGCAHEKLIEVDDDCFQPKKKTMHCSHELGAVLLLVCGTAISEAQNRASLKGIVSDRTQGVYVAPAKVSVRCLDKAACDLKEFSTTLSASGEFSFDLLPGTYQISTTIPWAFPYRRAPLQLHAGNDMFLRITPRMKILGVGLNVAGPDIVSKAPSPKYDWLPIEEGRKALIEYDKKKTNGNQVEYHYGVFTFQDWTISADVIIFDREDQSITSKGRATVQHGKQFKTSDFQTTTLESIGANFKPTIEVR